VRKQAPAPIARRRVFENRQDSARGVADGAAERRVFVQLDTVLKVDQRGVKGTFLAKVHHVRRLDIAVAQLNGMHRRELSVDLAQPAQDVGGQEWLVDDVEVMQRRNTLREQHKTGCCFQPFNVHERH